MITGQQARVRARYPAARPGDLKLLPAPRANPAAARPSPSPCSMTGTANGSTRLGPLRTRDGAEMDSARRFPTPTGTLTPSVTQMPGSRSTSSPSYLITAT